MGRFIYYLNLVRNTLWEYFHVEGVQLLLCGLGHSGSEPEWDNHEVWDEVWDVPPSHEVLFG